MFRSELPKTLRLILTALAVLSPFVSTRTALGQGAPQALALALNRPLEIESRDPNRQEFAIDLEGGEIARIELMQFGADVILTTVSPRGEEIAVSSSASGYFGKESILIYAAESGKYVLKLWMPRRSLAPHKIKLELIERRPAATNDLIRLQAQQRCTEAINLNYRGTRETNYRGTPENKQLAVTKYQQAVSLWGAANEPFFEIDALLHLGLIYLDLGEAHHAVRVFQKSLAASRANRDRSGEMHSLRLLAESYQLIGDLRLAQERFEESVKFNQEPGGFLIELYSRNSLADIACSQGEVDRGIKAFNEARNLSKVYGLQKFEGMVLYNLGKVHFSMGQYQDALDALHEAQKLQTSLTDITFTLNTIGKIYLALGDQPKAREYFYRAFEIAERSGNQIILSGTLNNLGLTVMAEGQSHSALEFFQQSLDLSRNNGAKPETIDSLTNLGKLNSQDNKLDAALRHFENSLALSREIGERNREMINLAEMGMIYRSQGDGARALEHLVPALEISRELRCPRYEADILYNLAWVSKGRSDHERARNQIKDAIAISEKLRAEFILQDMRASFMGTVQDYYRFYIDALMRESQSPGDGLSAEALHVSEMARARSLLDMIAESKVDIRSGVSPELLKQEESLRRNINWKSEQLVTASSTEEQKNRLRKNIHSLEAELELIETKIRQESPSYAALTQPHPLKLKEIQEQVIVDDKTLLLEYSLGKEVSYLWEVGRNSFEAHRLPGRSEIESMAEKFKAAVSKRPSNAPGQRATEMATIAELGASLSRHLLGPLAARLKGQRLIIIGDGALLNLPFAALPMPILENAKASAAAVPAKQVSSSPAVYLPMLVNHQILLAQSATTIATQRDQLKNRPMAPRTLAVLADPVFGKYDDRVLNNLHFRRKAIHAGSLSIIAERERSFGGNDLAFGFGAPLVAGPRMFQSPSGGSPRLPLSNDEQPRPAKADAPVPEKQALIPRLPFTRDEATGIFKLAPEDSILALDFDANRPLAMNPRLGDYRYVHFALHGNFDNNRPTNSGLLFSMVDEYGQPRQGLLTLKDVYKLKLPVEMVVLSACQSGLGREIKGEGVLGLTRAFMHVGARRVVTSLWNVNDAATAEMMKTFYQGMLSNRQLPPNEALRQAQLSVWKEAKWKAPYFWSAFVLQGEW